MPPFLELMQDHKSGSYIPYSLLTSTGKMQETRPTDFHSYPRRLASLNVISKEAHSPQLNLRCWVLFLRPSARQLSPALYNTGQAAVTTSLLHCCILTLWQTFLKVSFSSMTSELVRFSVEFSWYRNVPSFSSWKNKKTVQSMRRDSVGNCILTLIGWLVTYFGCSIVVCSICRLDVTYFFFINYLAMNS